MKFCSPEMVLDTNDSTADTAHDDIELAKFVIHCDICPRMSVIPIADDAIAERSIFAITSASHITCVYSMVCGCTLMFCEAIAFASVSAIDFISSGVKLSISSSTSLSPLLHVLFRKRVL
jgi:hypothetical protein